MPIYLWNGTVLVDSGKVAVHEDCCCGEECCNVLTLPGLIDGTLSGDCLDNDIEFVLEHGSEWDYSGGGADDCVSVILLDCGNGVWNIYCWTASGFCEWGGSLTQVSCNPFLVEGDVEVMSVDPECTDCDNCVDEDILHVVLVAG